MAKQIKLDPSVNGKGLTPSSERGAHMKRSMRDMVLNEVCGCVWRCVSVCVCVCLCVSV